MSNMLRVVRGLSASSVAAHKLRWKIELATLYPTEPLLIFSKVDHTAVMRVDMHTRQYHDIKKHEAIAKEMERTVGNGVSIMDGLAREVDKYIDSIEKCKEWPGDNREDIRVELKKWLKAQENINVAQLNEEKAKLNTHHMRMKEKVRERVEKMERKVKETIEEKRKLKDAAVKEDDDRQRKATENITARRISLEAAASLARDTAQKAGQHHLLGIVPQKGDPFQREGVRICNEEVRDHSIPSTSNVLIDTAEELTALRINIDALKELVQTLRQENSNGEEAFNALKMEKDFLQAQLQQKQ
jgi:hypothetical protein